MQLQARHHWTISSLCQRTGFRTLTTVITGYVFLIAIFIPEYVKAQNCTSTPVENPPSAHITDNLIALYTFFDGGNTVHDVSNVGEPLNLDISDPSKVEWLNNGGLHFISDSGIAISNGPATKLFDNIVATNELTIETWVHTGNLVQEQARIASFSINTSTRNATLSLHRDGLVVRVRTPQSGLNGGNPEYDPPNVIDTKLHHVVAIFNGERIRSYVDGIKVKRDLKLSGGLTNWDPSFPFMLGNEATLNRHWLGKLYLVAVYNRALSLNEIQTNFQAGLPDDSDTYPPQSTLIVRVEGSGNVALDPPRGVYYDNTEVTLTAMPDSGWVFSGWSGVLSGNTTPETITVDANKTVTAIFTEQQIVGVAIDEIPEMYSLKQNYPNPFNPSTIIKFSVPEYTNVTIKVYNLNGQEVAELADGFFPAGTHKITFKPKRLPGGVYVYELRADEVKQARRLIYVK